MTIKINPVVNGNAVCQASLIGKPVQPRSWFIGTRLRSMMITLGIVSL